MSQPAIQPRPSAGAATAREQRPVRLLIVDDEEVVRLALAKFLRSRGYQVETAASGQAALDHLARGSFELMLCDVRMPGMSGLELLPQARGHDEDLAVVMLTAVNDAPTARGALSRGAADYLMKPIELTDLHAAVERALHRRTLGIEQRRVEEVIREEVESRTAELEHEKRALRELSISIVESLTNAMEAKDQYLRGSSQRVADLAASIANAMKLDEDTIDAVRLAGRVMDVGKIGIQEVVMNKPGPLTPEEFEHVKDHVRIGMEILSPLRHLGQTLEYVQDHHERLDGTGYPRGLRGEEISIGGRILTAADAYNALTSRRSFRNPMTPAETLDVLGQQVGVFLDPTVFAALRAVVSRRKSLVFIEEKE